MSIILSFFSFILSFLFSVFSGFSYFIIYLVILVAEIIHDLELILDDSVRYQEMDCYLVILPRKIIIKITNLELSKPPIPCTMPNAQPLATQAKNEEVLHRDIE